MDCQSGYSYHQQDKQILGGCLRNREGQAAYASLNCVVWHLFVDSLQVLQLSHLYMFFLSRIDYCNSLLFGSTHDVTCHSSVNNWCSG